VRFNAHPDDLQWAEFNATRKKFDIDGPHGPIPVTMLIPKIESEKPFPLFIYYHGGGMVFGEAEDALMYMLGRNGNGIAVGVDYRLAPESPFPKGVLDCYTVLRYLVDHSSDFNIDPNRVIVSGASAGGLMASVSAALSVHGYGDEAPKLKYPLAGQILIFPVLEYPGARHQSWLEFSHMGALSAQQMHWFWQMYTHPSDRSCSDYLCHPMELTKEELSKLPPAVIFTASADVLRDEGRKYHRMLVDAGVNSQHFEGRGTHLGAGIFDAETVQKTLAAGIELIKK